MTGNRRNAVVTDRAPDRGNVHLQIVVFDDPPAPDGVHEVVLGHQLTVQRHQFDQDVECAIGKLNVVGRAF